MRAAICQRGAGPESGNFLQNLFNGGGNNPIAPPGGDLGPQSGTFRTVCVRSCDGFYFPISFATVPGRFPDDERTCKSLCPAADANLFTYRNPGEDINSAVSINGQPYSSIPNAFHYRQEFSPTCSCKAPGQTWSDALKSIDDKAAAEQQGDIIVTEESAKKMARPLPKPVPAAAKKGTGAAGPAASAPAPDTSVGAATSSIPDPTTSRFARSARPLSRHADPIAEGARQASRKAKAGSLI